MSTETSIWFSQAPRVLREAVFTVLFFSSLGCLAATPKSCRKVELSGEVQAGQEWRAAFGQGWIFRVLPIQPAKGSSGQSYSGWDLVVDREQPVGFPDALLLATPPYDSINEREVGTTFALRAQDALGWNPRSFRFLTSAEALSEGQKLFWMLHQGRRGAGTGALDTAQVQSLRRLMTLSRKAAAGQFRILDAHLVPGLGDAAPYAQNWALAAAHTPHTFEPAANGQTAPLGEWRWMRFSITLWLPEGWKTPKSLPAERADCVE
jgi:hypothetical protein